LEFCLVESLPRYQEGKRLYQAKLQEGKLKSWKDFCSRTADSNPWGVVYKLASGKMQSKTTWTTLKTQDGTYTTDIVSTMEHMMEYFIPDDNESSDSAPHTHTHTHTHQTRDRTT